MKVIIGNNTFFVNFTHAEVDRKEEFEKELRFTGCVITVEGPEENKFLGAGTVKCYHKDTYNKEVGRQHSLNAALEDAGFPKHIRTTFWDTYRAWGKQRF